MKDSATLSNNQVADLYQNLLGGDKNALYKLQQVNFKNHLPKFIESYYNKKAKRQSQDNQHQESHQSQNSPQIKEEPEYKKETALSAALVIKKDNAFLNALKRGAKMGILSKNQTRQTAGQRITNSSNLQYQPDEKNQILSKQNNKQYRLSKKDNSPQVKSNKSLDKPTDEKSKIYALPKVTRVKESGQMIKAQSAHIQVVKKNLILNQIQLDKKEVVKKPKTKVNFREMIGANKKLKMQFQRHNQQERLLQMQIIQYHQSTKLFIEAIKQKHALNFNNKAKYIKRKTKIQDQIIHQQQSSQEKQSQEKKSKTSPFKMAIDAEKAKCEEITEQLVHFNIMFNNKRIALNKLTKKIDSSSFQAYLENKKETIQEVSDQQLDLVQPLQNLDQDPKNKYSFLMAHTRDKKWGLHQRTQYETQRTNSLAESRQTSGLSQHKFGEDSRHLQLKSEQNKVVVNERLKNLLFS